MFTPYSLLPWRRRVMSISVWLVWFSFAAVAWLCLQSIHFNGSTDGVVFRKWAWVWVEHWGGQAALIPTDANTKALNLHREHLNFHLFPGKAAFKILLHVGFFENFLFLFLFYFFSSIRYKVQSFLKFCSFSWAWQPTGYLDKALFWRVVLKFYSGS